MARKKRGHRMPAWKKWARMGVGLLGTAVGAGVALSPTYRGLQTAFSGDFAGGLDQVAQDTTGISPRYGTPLDVGKVVRTGVTVGIGIGLISLFRYVARRV